MNKKEIEDYCKEMHLNSAKKYFKTKEFKVWVNAVWRLHKELEAENER